MYDGLYDTLAEIEPCDEPAESSLRLGLDWDDGNLTHINDLTSGQIIAGIEAGYYFLGTDPIECRYRYLFQPEPPMHALGHFRLPVYRLIVDTSAGTFRPVTVFKETNPQNVHRYEIAKKRGELE